MDLSQDVLAALATAGLGAVDHAELIRDSPGRPVWRVGLGGGESLIVKDAVSDDEELWAAVRRDGLALDAASRSGVTPQLVLLDEERRVMAQADLGKGRNLADVLLGDDAVEAEALLVVYAQSLAHLHNATEDAALVSNRFQLGGLEAVLERLQPGLNKLGIDVDHATRMEIHDLANRVGSPGRWTSLVHGDACPDNTILTADGTLSFFDFEYGGRGHGLLDLAFLHLPFPTCWCLGRLPADAVAQAEHAYRELRSHIGTEMEFQRTLADVVAAASLISVSWHLDTILEADDQWGTATLRQRPPARLEALTAIAHRTQHLPAVSQLGHNLAQALHDRWPLLDRLAPYPAFAPAGGKHAI